MIEGVWVKTFSGPLMSTLSNKSFHVSKMLCQFGQNEFIEMLK